MRKLILLFFVIFLIACENFSLLKLKTDLKQIAIKQQNENYSNFKKYYSFYLEPDISIVKSDDTATIFNYQNQQFSLNVNVANIIQKHYFKEDDKSQFRIDVPIVFEIKDEALNNRKQSFNYQYQLLKLKDKFFIRIQSDEFILEANVLEKQIIAMSSKMMNILKSSKLNEDKIIENFSSKYTITSKKKQVDLFKVLLPSTISLEEVLKNSNDYLIKQQGE